MIDTPQTPSFHTPSGPQGPGERAPESRRELYGELFRQSALRNAAASHSGRGTHPWPEESSADADTSARLAPPPPRSLAETGLTLASLADLTLKVVYLHGSLTGGEICAQVRLPFSVLEDVLTFLRRVRCLEVQSGELLGQLTYRFHLSEEGRTRAREAFAQSRYVGPAPVSLRSYIEQCRKQGVSEVACTADRLRPAFSGMLLPPGLLDELGPAVCDGQAIFLHGPPGNGKTLIARRLGRFLNTDGGEIYIPYAIQVDGAIVTLFDPNVHQTTDDAEAGDGFSSLPVAPVVPEAEAKELAETSTRPASSALPMAMWSEPPVDARWRRIRRPVVVTAGELTLDMLDLRYNAESRYYTAPTHLKANGGVFVIDDFGRQRVSPRELLNRWILPLAERIDYLTLATGKKFAVPFEQLVVFSTNLNPQELVDDAFLRRIRHKLAVSPPTREQFTRLFEQCCAERRWSLDPECIGDLFTNRYSQARPPRWSDPQDLLEVAGCICRFRGEEPRLNRELMIEAARRFFGA